MPDNKIYIFAGGRKVADGCGKALAADSAMGDALDALKVAADGTAHSVQDLQAFIDDINLRRKMQVPEIKIASIEDTHEWEVKMGLINTDDIKVQDFKSLWKQAEKFGWKGPEECISPRQIVIVPKNEYDFFGKEAVNALEDKHKVLVVPVDYTDPFENSMAQYATAHLATAVNVPTSRLFELPDSAKERIEIDTTDMPNPRYHDRTFPKDYYKKKKAKRRQQKQARRRNK